MKQVILTVTDEDIRNGVPDDECDCPVALALRRLLSDDYDVAVDPVVHGLMVDGFVVCADVPQVIREFVTWFDAPPQVQEGLEQPTCVPGGFSVPLMIAPEHEHLFNADFLTEVRA
jgi:hypothetical protein